MVNTVTTKLKFHHYFVKCVLTCSTKPLHKWGFEQARCRATPRCGTPTRSGTWRTTTSASCRTPRCGTWPPPSSRASSLSGRWGGCCTSTTTTPPSSSPACCPPCCSTGRHPRHPRHLLLILLHVLRPHLRHGGRICQGDQLHQEHGSSNIIVLYSLRYNPILRRIFC